MRLRTTGRGVLTLTPRPGVTVHVHTLNHFKIEFVTIDRYRYLA